VILGSQLDADDAATATLKVRATAVGIREISERLSQEGRITKQAVTGVHLAAPIGDSAKRLLILSEYRARLEGLRQKTNADLSNLMRLNSELAEVQGQIEALSGEGTSRAARSNADSQHRDSREQRDFSLGAAQHCTERICS
jgi:hypothetical protein